MLKDIGPMELGIILVIVFIVFGAGKLPEIFGSAGKAIRAFRESQQPELAGEEAKPLRHRAKSANRAAAQRA
jgi:sec-independent protein translocase protein TatA